MGTHDIYQLKVTLKGIRPAVWRRLQVPGVMTMGALHVVLQDAFDWDDSHLHQFVVGRTCIGEPDPSGFDRTIDEAEVRLGDIAKVKARISYEYDFGDCWRHEILVEKLLPTAKGVDYPRCVAGKRACPPDDCGGAWGYADRLEALADPEHEEHEEVKEWLGKDFDPEAFDIARINAILHQTFHGTRRRSAGSG